MKFDEKDPESAEYYVYNTKAHQKIHKSRVVCNQSLHRRRNRDENLYKSRDRPLPAPPLGKFMPAEAPHLSSGRKVLSMRSIQSTFALSNT